MKNKGVIISILIILCFGAFVTVNTRRYLAVNMETEAPSEAYKSAMLPDWSSEAARSAPPAPASSAAGAAPLAAGVSAPSSQDATRGRDQSADASARALSGAAAGQGSSVAQRSSVKQDEADGAAVPEMTGGAVPEAAAMPSPAAAVADSTEEKKQSSSVAISPLTGSQAASEKKASSTLTRADYAKKLADLDAQIQKMKDSEVEPNTDSYKNMADYEYRSWDSELNAIYQELLNCMPEDDAQALRLEEREWMKERDLTARKVISKYNGGTIESLEYTASLADSTRTRAYALLEEYGSYLDGVLSELEEETAADVAKDAAGGV